MKTTINHIKIFFVSLFLVAFSCANAQKCVSGNCKNGKGIWQYANGNKVEAEFTNEIYTTGKLTSIDGTVYEGEFKKEYFDGKGYLKKKNGDFMIGIFKKDTLYSGYEYKNKVVIQKTPKLSNAELTKIGQGINQLKKEELTEAPLEIKPQEVAKPVITTVEKQRLFNPNASDSSYTHFIYTGKLVNGVPEDENGIGVYFSKIDELYTYTGSYKNGKREGTGELENSKNTLQKAKKNKQKLSEKYNAEFINDIEQKNNKL